MHTHVACVVMMLCVTGFYEVFVLSCVRGCVPMCALCMFCQNERNVDIVCECVCCACVMCSPPIFRVLLVPFLVPMLYYTSSIPCCAPRSRRRRRR